MSEPESTSSTRIYQLKIFLREISPMIWRRLLVRGDTTLVELHEFVQLAMGWENYHLWTFSINGGEYGHAYGAGLRKETYGTTLSDLGLRVRERFLYTYDFGDYWQHEMRLEKIIEPEPKKDYPVCIAVARGPARRRTAEGHGSTKSCCILPRARSEIASVDGLGKTSVAKLASIRRRSTADGSTPC